LDTTPLKRFIVETTSLVEAGLAEEMLVPRVRDALSLLLTQDDWLDSGYQEPGAQYYRQYLLYCDPFERFSIQSFVWGPGQSTPIHDHTVWGLVGVYRGAEKCQRYSLVEGALIPDGTPFTLSVGEIDLVSPTVGDIHTVSNAFDDQVSISIHVYGGNVGNIKRHVFDPVTSAAKPFVSGYSNAQMPNIWDQSLAIRTSMFDSH
jgi:predicted metal-dependent enzyme (double-stranded beta helix superfamily)